MATKYELKNNQILREGVPVANRDPVTFTVDYLPDMDRYRAPVSQWLAAEGLSKPPVVPPEVAARMAEVRTAGADPVPASEPTASIDLPDAKFTPKEPPAAPPVEARVTMDLTPEQARIKELEYQLAAARAAAVASVTTPAPAQTVIVNNNAELPAPIREVHKANAEQALFNTFYAAGCPRMDQAMGTKTPAFVRWVAKNRPDQARTIWPSARLLGGKYIEEIITEEAAQA